MIACGHRVALNLIFVALAGCVTSPDYQPPVPDVPARWGEAPGSQESAAAAESPWWTTFNDPEMTALVERAVEANLDLQLAGARVREARGRRGATTASLWPSVNARVSMTRGRESGNAPGPVLLTPGGQIESRAGQSENLFQAGFDAAWELDVFGGRRRSIEAAQADLESSIYDRGAVRLTLLAEVARTYIELRGLQQQRAVVEAGMAVQQETLELTRARYAGGMAADLDVARAEAEVQLMASQIPALDTSYKEAVHRLSVLLGRPPAALADELLPGGPIPVAAIQPPLGLPSDLLRQRPDIQRAERKLAAASARRGVAVADLYPKFSLLGTAGLASVAAGDFFSGANILWSIGPSMTWPIFRGGQIVATVEVRDAQQQQALIEYRRAILNGLEDVENAVVAYTRERDRRTSLAAAVDSYRRAADLAQTRYMSGLTDFRDVLDAQRNLFHVQSQLSRSETAVSLVLVALYKALGGGWSAMTHPPDPASRNRGTACQTAAAGGSECSTLP